MVEEKKILLKDLLTEAGKQLRQDFEEIRKSNPHSGESGAEVELILKEFLKGRLPRRFDVESGLVVGVDGEISAQTDLIVFDALNSPVYRKGSRLHIIPRDNVAAVVEVKSKLNKAELEDAAAKIASVKSIQASPITVADQPVNFSNMIMTRTFGCVFAFDSYTSLETLAENLKEINSKYDSKHWIDCVIVLDKGILGYMVQLPFKNEMPGWLGGACSDDFIIPPFYVHLVKQDVGDLALNQFFVKLMSQLTFFRKRSTIPFEAALGKETLECMTIQGYQYNLKGQLIHAQETHQAGKFQNPKIRFNLYAKKDGIFKGQVCLLPWQDGATITCSVNFPPAIIFRHYFSALNLKGNFIQGAKDENMWYSSVHDIKDDDFIRLSSAIHPDIISVRDGDDDLPPPGRIDVASIISGKGFQK